MRCLRLEDPDPDCTFEHVFRRARTLFRVIALAAWPTFSLTEAYAHDYWRNGEPVPSWVKVACCGRTDAHHLLPDEVRRNAAADYVGRHLPMAYSGAIGAAQSRWRLLVVLL